MTQMAWGGCIALEESKVDLARFLSETIMQKGVDVSASFELVTGGGFSNATEVRSTGRQKVPLQGNHEANAKLILHSYEVVSEGCARFLIKSTDTDVMLLLLHFMPGKAAQVRMISRTTRKRKSYPVHIVSETPNTYYIGKTCSFFML